MKNKIKHIFLVLIVIFSSVAIRAQTKEQSDSTKTGSEKKVNVLLGTQNYNRFVGDMDVVKGDKLKNYPAMMLEEALEGQLPGVFMMQNNGNPGEDNFTTYIRGNVGQFIILIDGIERPLNPYDIEQIEEVTVLKDPVSKALYGGRISNGIIIVTTKHGKSMKSEFHASVQRGIKMPTSIPKYLDAYDFATYYNQALANDGIATGVYNQAALDAYQNHTSPLQYPNVDYYGQFLNKSMDITRISTEYYGGNESTKFYVHGGYQKEGGLEAYGSRPRQMQTFNLQGNVDSKFSDAIMLHVNVMGYESIKQYPGMYTGVANSDGSHTNGTFLMYTLSNRYPNAYPIFVGADSVGGTSTYKDNPYAGEAQSGYTIENSTRMQSNIGLDIKLDKLLEGLTLKPLFVFDIYHEQNLTKISTVGIYSIGSFDANGKPLTFNTLQSKILATSQSLGTYNYGRNWGFTTTLNYQHEFGKSSINADLNYFLSKYVLAGTLLDYKRQNVGLRVNYTYNDRYTIEGVLNYCGSQSYVPDKRFETFPALGAGWLISKEDFMKDISFVDFLKLNASWGIMGDGNITPYLYRETWGAGTSYPFNTSTTVPTTVISQVSSQNLDWPKQREIDISLESKMLKKIGWKISYFDYLQTGTLSQVSNNSPLIVGGTNYLPWINYGKTGLKGIEAELSYKGNVNDFKYEIGTHLTHSMSKKIKIDELADPNYSTVGQPWDNILGFQAIGTYTQAQIDQINAGTSTMPMPTYMSSTDLKAGNIIYKDVNGDGKLDKYDYTVIGNNSPRLMYGWDFNLSYKGFSLYVMFLGYGDYKSYLGNSYYQINSTRKYSEVVIDGLPNGNPAPRLTTGTASNDFQPSNYWIVNNGFLKLKDLSLSYSLPENVTKRLKMSEMKVFLYGTNVLTFSKIKLSDPESLNAGLTDYPLFSTYAIGLSISF